MYSLSVKKCLDQSDCEFLRQSIKGEMLYTEINNFFPKLQKISNSLEKHWSTVYRVYIGNQQKQKTVAKQPYKKAITVLLGDCRLPRNTKFRFIISF